MGFMFMGREIIIGFVGYILIALFLFYLFGFLVPLIIHDLRLARELRGILPTSVHQPGATPAGPTAQNQTEDKGKLYDEALAQRKKTKGK
jgi:hypothetical protein